MSVDLSPIGSGMVMAAAIPALALMVVCLAALWGSAPSQRPEIIRALADLISAARRHRNASRRNVTRPKPTEPREPE